MEAYDAAVLSYALATAATKIKPALLGIAPILPPRVPETESLTPPTRHENSQESDENRNYLYQLLCNAEQQITDNSPVQLAQLMEICATKQNQIDQQIIAHLEALNSELRQICKNNPSSTNLLQFKVEEEDDESQGVSLKTEIVCKTLTELFKQFGLVSGANVLKKFCVN